MNFNELTKEEKDKFFADIIKGNYANLEELIRFFHPLMKKVYSQQVKETFIISKEEFIQETSIVLYKRIKNFWGRTLGKKK